MSRFAWLCWAPTVHWRKASVHDFFYTGLAGAIFYEW